MRHKDFVSASVHYGEEWETSLDVDAKRDGGKKSGARPNLLRAVGANLEKGRHFLILVVNADLLICRHCFFYGTDITFDPLGASYLV